MSDFKMTARIESENARHASISVFQNGGKAGVLIVDANYAELVVERIEGSEVERLKACLETELHNQKVYGDTLSQLNAANAVCEEAKNVVKDAWPGCFTHLIDLLRARWEAKGEI